MIPAHNNHQHCCGNDELWVTGTEQPMTVGNALHIERLAEPMGLLAHGQTDGWLAADKELPIPIPLILHFEVGLYKFS